MQSTVRTHARRARARAQLSHSCSEGRVANGRGATCVYALTKTRLETSTTAAVASRAGACPRRTSASATRPATSAKYDERECVQRRPAKSNAASGVHATSGGRRRTSHATASSKATTKTYELASGERKVETRRRKGCSFPVL